MHFFAKSLLSLLFLITALAASAAEQPFPSGNTQASPIHFQFAIYYPGAPRTDPLATLRSLASKDGAGLTVIAVKPSTLPAARQVQGVLEKNIKKYAVPNPESLKLFGRGLSAEQISALQGSRQVLIMNFAHPATQAVDGLRGAYALAEQLARTTNGLLWDEETREMFSIDQWHERRLAKWTSGIPELSLHTTIHLYRDGELQRAITLGMGKFGLPDLVVDQFPSATRNQVGKLINALAQVLAEGAPVGGQGHIELHLGRIAHPLARAEALKDLGPKARKFAKLQLLVARPEDGDPANRIAAIGFARYTGPDLQARQGALLSSLFGGEDSVKAISHSEELKQASARAKVKLAAIEADFKRGLRPGEHLQVKAPFTTSEGGNEWMWVEITKWRGNDMEGTLSNDPFDVPGLQYGQVVKVRLDQVFDYIRKLPDGTREGNTTGVIIEKMQGKTRSK